MWHFVKEEHFTAEIYSNKTECDNFHYLFYKGNL